MVRKSLVFIRVSPEIEKKPGFRLYKFRSCVKCSYDSERQLFFPQWYEVLDDSELTLDYIDETLKCVRLRWHRNPAAEDMLSESKEFELVPVERI